MLVGLFNLADKVLKDEGRLVFLYPLKREENIEAFNKPIEEYLPKDKRFELVEA